MHEEIWQFYLSFQFVIHKKFEYLKQRDTNFRYQFRIGRATKSGEYGNISEFYEEKKRTKIYLKIVWN